MGSNKLDWTGLDALRVTHVRLFTGPSVSWYRLLLRQTKSCRKPKIKLNWLDWQFACQF